MRSVAALTADFLEHKSKSCKSNHVYTNVAYVVDRIVRNMRDTQTSKSGRKEGEITTSFLPDFAAFTQ